MKTLLFIALLSTVGCTHYTTTKIGKNKVMVSKTTTVLAFHGGTVYTCGLDQAGVVTSCVENNIETEQSKQERAEREKKEKEQKEVQRRNLGH